MSTKNSVRNIAQGPLFAGVALSTLMIAMAMSTTVSAQPLTDAGENTQASMLSVDELQRAEDRRIVSAYVGAQGAPVSEGFIDQLLAADPGMGFLDQADDAGSQINIISDGTGTAKFEVVGQSVISGDIKASVYAHSNSDPEGEGPEGLLAFTTGSGLLQSSSGGVFRTRDGQTYASAATTGVVFIIPYTYGLYGSTSSDIGTYGTHYGVYGSAQIPLDTGLFEPGDGALEQYGVFGTTNQSYGYGVYAENTYGSSTEPNTAFYAKSRGDNWLVGAGGSGFVDSATAVIENQNTGSSNALSIYLSEQVKGDNYGTGDYFVSFVTRNADDNGIAWAGGVRGNLFGTGVDYASSSSDMAEWLERSNPGEEFAAGEIVGIADGKVIKDLSKAHHVGVISTSPAFSGNSPGPEKEHLFELVAFIGQVPARVSGIVHAGDYIVASAGNDGVGIPIATKDMTPENYRMLVGRAWESSSDAGVKLVNTAVGLAANDAYAYMHKQDQRIASLESSLSGKMAQLERLTAQMEMLTRKVAYMESSNMLATATKK